MITRDFQLIFEEAIELEGRMLVFEFFIAFSRFECALLNTIEFATRHNNKTVPNWDKFISTIKDSFNQNRTNELNKAIEYIITNPPKIHQLENDQLVWLPRNINHNTPLITQLSLHIRTIRNNLFHGGKFNGVYEPDVSRNYRLIRSSLIILNEWLSLNESVKNKFLERII